MCSQLECPVFKYPSHVLLISNKEENKNKTIEVSYFKMYYLEQLNHVPKLEKKIIFKF